MATFRTCADVGCPTLVPRGRNRCAKHQGAAQQRDVQRRGTAHQRGYTAAVSAEMQRYGRAHRWCEDHLDQGERVAMQIVDHIIAMRDGGSPHGPFRSLCRSCHGFKTAREVRARGGHA